MPAGNSYLGHPVLTQNAVLIRARLNPAKDEYLHARCLAGTHNFIGHLQRISGAQMKMRLIKLLIKSELQFILVLNPSRKERNAIVILR